MQKRILTFIYTIFTVLQLHGQCNLAKDQVTLDANCASSLVTGLAATDQVVSAADQVTFTAGFSLSNTSTHTFTATITNPKTTDPINYIDDNNLKSGTSAEFNKSDYIPGTMGGSINISPSGTASYNIPIQVPPGSNGVQPNLSIVYNSQGGNGLLGWGWGLSGLSAISRTGQELYYDGATSPVTMTSADKLILDGQRLISTGTNTYAPENDPYTKVTFNGTYFTVTTIDGTVMEYGNNSDNNNALFIVSPKADPIIPVSKNTEPLTWGISKITDPEGNYIQFFYNGEPSKGEYTISEIKYTGNSLNSKAPYNNIKFYYSLRSDASFAYIAGNQLSQEMLLTDIKVYCEGKESKTYNFKYYNDGQYSKLNQVYFTADGKKYNPAIVNWGEKPDYATTITDAGAMLGKLSDNNQFYFGDVNGDGLTDIIQWNNYLEITVKLAGANGTYITKSITYADVSETCDASLCINRSNSVISIAVTDINQDGKDEILAHYYHLDKYTPKINTTNPCNGANTGGYTYHIKKLHIDSYSYNGTSFISKSEKVTDIYGPSTLSPEYCSYPTILPLEDEYKFYYADFNYDNKPERIIVKNGTLSAIEGITLTPMPTINNVDELQIVDFNGDGRPDILSLSTTGYGSIWGYNGTTLVNLLGTGASRFFGKPMNVAFGDFNGDGRTDYISYNGETEIYYATEKGFVNRLELISIEDVENFLEEEFLVRHIIKSDPSKVTSYPYGHVYAYHRFCNLDRPGFNDHMTGTYHPPLYSEALGPDPIDDSRYSDLFHTSSFAVDDINNDGKSDIISAYQNQLFIYISTGNKIKEIQPIEIPPHDIHGLGKIQILVADINNDGQKEIIFGKDMISYQYAHVNTCFINCSSSPGSSCDDNIEIKTATPTKINYQIISFNTRLNQALRVKSITDGNNVSTALTYGNVRTNDNTPYTYPEVPVKQALYLVTACTQTDQNTNTVLANYTYAYDKAYYHALGRGFLGFKTFTVSNSINGTVNTSNFNFTIPGTSLYSAWPASITSKKGGTIVATATTTTIEAKGGDATKKWFMPLVTKSVNTDNLTGISTTNTINSFNTTTGRVTQQTTSTSDGWSVSTQTTYATVTGNITKPTVVTATRTKGADSYVTTTTLAYDAAIPLRVISKTVKGTLPGGASKEVKTEYADFDPYGNAKSIKVIGTDGNQRSSTYTYDGYGRFTQSVKEGATGFESSAVYNPYDGTPVSQTDFNGRNTTYSYAVSSNSFTATTTLPDGTALTGKTTWDATSAALYTVEKKASNSNNIVTQYLNAAGQVVKETSRGYKGAVLTTAYEYYPDGAVKKATYTAADKTLVTDYTYYPDGRLWTVKGLNTDIRYTYYNNNVTVTDNITGITKSQTTDALGNTTQVGGTMGQVDYSYFASGKVKEITTGGLTTSMEYDPLGNQTKLIDPNAGTTEYTYNGFGQLLTQKQNTQGPIICNYDNGGRLLSKTGVGMSYEYYPDNETGKKGLLKAVTRDGVTEAYDYDGLGRLSSVTTTGDGKTFKKELTYNDKGYVATAVYSAAGTPFFTLKYQYDDYGNLIQINDNAGSKIWAGDAQNGLGQWTQYSLGNGLVTRWGYDANNHLSSIKTGTTTNATSIQNLGFTFNTLGQLTGRTDGTLSETFSYDPLDRLKQTKVAGLTAIDYTYKANGNIESTSWAGAYAYNNTKHPHAVTGVNGAAGSTGNSALVTSEATYTLDNKIASLYNQEGATLKYTHDFTYGPGGNRFKVVFKEGSNIKAGKIYAGECEFGYNAVGTEVYKRVIITAPTGVCAVYQDSANVKEIYYIHTDYLGSWLGITNQSGSLKNRNSYDAWGRPRNPRTWELMPVNVANALGNLNKMQPRFDRGYTGHEIMAGFGLINMNGRLYDPYLQRFLSPDNYVQAPDNGQSYNRYAYCLNNPLRYTDPSGYAWYDWLNPFYAFNRLMQAINDNTTGVRKKMQAAGVPDFNVTYSGGKASIVAGPHNAQAGVAYDFKNNRAGFASNTGGFTNYYYPTYDYSTPERKAVAAFDESINYQRLQIQAKERQEASRYRNLLINVSPVERTTISENFIKTANRIIDGDFNLLLEMISEAGPAGLIEGPISEINFAQKSGLSRLNLFKWGAKQTGEIAWETGDYMLYLPNRGTPKLNWEANYGALRREMSLGKPIYDSYRLPNGELIPTGGFLNAERYILETRGWIYDPSVGAWMPPF